MLPCPHSNTSLHCNCPAPAPRRVSKAFRRGCAAQAALAWAVRSPLAPGGVKHARPVTIYLLHQERMGRSLLDACQALASCGAALPKP